MQAVVDATGSPELGVAIALESIRAKKHIVMMNVECDVTVGADAAPAGATRRA